MAPPRSHCFTRNRKEPNLTRPPLVVAATLASLHAACGAGLAVCENDPAACATPAESAPAEPTVASEPGAESDAAPFRGDGSRMPSFGGWGGDPMPAEAIARAGFEWFETGYPRDPRANEILRSAGVRPFAYVSLSELPAALWDEAGYTGPVLRTNERWGGSVVDVTHPSWQDWLVRRADEAHRTGSRGVKWDAATPDVPPGRTRADVNDAIAAVMRRVLDQHPDMKFIFNQGFDFALAHPELVHAMQTEGLFSARSRPEAYLAPWNDPFYWGPQLDALRALQARGIPVLVAEYADPWSEEARALYEAITAQGFVPFVTSESWDVRGLGYCVEPGW